MPTDWPECVKAKLCNHRKNAKQTQVPKTFKWRTLKQNYVYTIFQVSFGSDNSTTASGGKTIVVDDPSQDTQCVTVYVITRWTWDKRDSECSETWIFQRREEELALDAYALADSDWVYLLWALLINTLGKRSADLLCTVIFPLLPLVIGEHRGPCPQLSGRWCFAGICGTENQAIYREHSSLRSSS